MFITDQRTLQTPPEFIFPILSCFSWNDAWYHMLPIEKCFCDRQTSLPALFSALTLWRLTTPIRVIPHR